MCSSPELSCARCGPRNAIIIVRASCGIFRKAERRSLLFSPCKCVGRPGVGGTLSFVDCRGGGVGFVLLRKHQEYVRVFSWKFNYDFLEIYGNQFCIESIGRSLLLFQVFEVPESEKSPLKYFGHLLYLVWFVRNSAIVKLEIWKSNIHLFGNRINWVAVLW